MGRRELIKIIWKGVKWLKFRNIVKLGMIIMKKLMELYFLFNNSKNVKVNKIKILNIFWKCIFLIKFRKV